MPERICNVTKCNRAAEALGYCNLHYQRLRAGRPLDVPAKVEHPHCTVMDCIKPPRSRYAELCPMHYHRSYRHGSVHATAHDSDVTASYGRQYKTRHRPGHPLASKHGVVYEHRLVLFEAIGPGPHTCYWCGDRVEWVGKAEPYELQPDHLNNRTDDNRIENLVPACRPCNTARGGQHRHEALKQAGFWSGHDTVARLSGGRVNRVDESKITTYQHA